MELAERLSNPEFIWRFGVHPLLGHLDAALPTGPTLLLT